MKKVSIITVNYNHSEECIAMLRSLQKVTYKSVELIVVDNASPDDDPLVISKEIPEARLVLSNKNLGFAGGNNLGMQYATGDIFLFLNFDTIVTDGFLDPIVEMLEDGDIGMVSPKIIFYDRGIIQYAGYTPLSKLTVRNSAIGHGNADSEEYSSRRETYAGHGAAMAVRRDCVQAVGDMPSEYFLYYEELDWSAMIRKAGYKIMFLGDSVVYHKGSISTGEDSPLKSYYINRNRRLYIRRNYSGVLKYIALLYQYCIVSTKDIIVSSVKGEWLKVRVLFRSLFGMPFSNR